MWSISAHFPFMVATDLLWPLKPLFWSLASWTWTQSNKCATASLRELLLGIPKKKCFVQESETFHSNEVRKPTQEAILIRLENFQTLTAKSGPSGTGRFWNTPARRPSSWPSSSSSGPTSSPARPGASPSWSRDSTTGPSTSGFCSKLLWPSCCPTRREWTSTFTCTRCVVPGGSWLAPSRLSSLSTTKQGSTSSGRYPGSLGGSRNSTTRLRTKQDLTRRWCR